MPRSLSGPERRAKALFERLQLCARINDNDGTKSPRKLWFRVNHEGTSVIKDGPRLHRDWDGGPVKNYKFIVPDKLLDGNDFLEIKGCINAKDWDSLSRDAFNDHIRLSLLRMHYGAVSYRIYSYCDLDPKEQSAVAGDLSKPEARRYVRLAELKGVVTSPACNLEPDWLNHGNKNLPIKVLAGMKGASGPGLFVLDSGLMDEWDKRLQ